MEYMFNKPGASEFLTPREVIRDFLNILNILRQNPALNKSAILETIEVVKPKNPDLESVEVDEI
jgi:hypothetical protein